MADGPSFPHRGMFAVRFAINVFVGATVVWYVLRLTGDSKPIWAVASMIASADPQVDVARRMFRSRLINVVVGCAVGLVFLVVGGSSEWKLPLTLAATVLVSSYLVGVPTMWRQAPITAAIVIAAGLHQSKLTGMTEGLHKVGEVLFGCLVGLAVSWLMAKVWPLERTKAESGADDD
jgi:uncharacterized membrane protein YccC